METPPEVSDENIVKTEVGCGSIHGINLKQNVKKWMV
jgi:hypothetical protein